MTDDIVSRFAKLFAGNTDFFYTDASRCTVWTFHDGSLYQRHLMGALDVGIYPMFQNDGQWFCHWGCVDIDVDDYMMADRLRRALHHVGITAWIEVSRSKGYHVWVFAEQAVSARVMRHALLAACAAAKADSKEVNPKSDGSNLGAGSPGNCVRLPYPGWLDEERESPSRRVMLDSGVGARRLRLAEFLADAEASLCPLETLERVAGYYQPPKRPEAVQRPSGPPSVDVETLLSRAGPLIRLIHDDGGLPSRETGRVDRSTTLKRLVYECQRRGFKPDEAMVLLTSADSRWGKFHDRADGEAQLQKMIGDVYS